MAVVTKGKGKTRVQEAGSAPVTVTVTPEQDAVAQAKAVLEAARAKAREAAAAAKAAAKTAREATKRAKAEPRPFCGHPTKDGGECRQRVLEGKTWCTDHRPASTRLSEAELAAFGRWLKAAGIPGVVAEIGWFRAKAIAKAEGNGNEQAA